MWNAGAATRYTEELVVGEDGATPTLARPKGKPRLASREKSQPTSSPGEGVRNCFGEIVFKSLIGCNVMSKLSYGMI